MPDQGRTLPLPPHLIPLFLLSRTSVWTSLLLPDLLPYRSCRVPVTDTRPRGPPKDLLLTPFFPETNLRHYWELSELPALSVLGGRGSTVSTSDPDSDTSLRGPRVFHTPLSRTSFDVTCVGDEPPLLLGRTRRDRVETSGLVSTTGQVPGSVRGAPPYREVFGKGRDVRVHPRKGFSAPSWWREKPLSRRYH